MKYPHCTIILFGSRAMNRHRASSDFDMAVVMGVSFDEIEMTAKMLKLRPRSIPIDLVAINRIPYVVRR